MLHVHGTRFFGPFTVQIWAFKLRLQNIDVHPVFTTSGAWRPLPNHCQFVFGANGAYQQMGLASIGTGVGGQ